MKFANKITLALIIPAFVVVPLLGGVVFYFSKNMVQENIVASQKELTKHTLNSIDRILYSAYQDIELISNEQFLEKYFESLDLSKKVTVDLNSEMSIKKELKEKLLLTGPWDMLAALDNTGRIFFSTQKKLVEKHVNEFSEIRAAFFMALKGQHYYSDLILSEETGRPTILFSAPIRSDLDSRILGVVIGQFAWPTVIEILDNLDPLNQVFLINENEMTIATQTEQRDKILKFSLAEYGLMKNQFLGKGASSGVVTIDEEVGPVLATVVSQDGYLGYRGNNWGLLIGVPLGVALEPVHRIAINIAILVGIIMATLAAVLYFVCRQLTRPIEYLTKTV